ncbi:Glycosyltransferase involved in cell wall bisynthesis [Desulfonispora thiosulfatigenes DSM 11270]|uniref:Glycosyltransferase involved in cell wall bisynthesis n=1 Tax=Desulfonispora thiosulfatigenes DSM 11270 TaxID=656914 RepID=A0A1W1V6G6_DESTI|nr:glycosyltransferase family 4 protein [Desulfonispora thiosulfatigenes]SMB88651.1 Glycosyltransferase involved in cell wall bisynthesis [Desulfonispora thiosulfatigenes DSM 11270]
MKILYVANVHRHFNAFHIPYIKWLKDNGHEVHVAANGEEVVPEADKKFTINIDRSPYKVANIGAYRELKKIIQEEKYNVIHCHTPMGGIIGRLASIGPRKEGMKVIYTCHGFHFCKKGPVINWLMYYPVERFMAKYTDVIITINNEDYQLSQKFDISKKYYIPGIGLDIEKFKRCSKDEKPIKKRMDIGVQSDDVLLVSVGDLTKRKNHQIVFKAIAKVKGLKIKYVLCGQGDQREYLMTLAKKLKIEDKVIFLGHRKDVKEILRVSDIFIFPSLWEGLGIAGIEAMAVGLPVIASSRHGIKDYAIHKETALLCDPLKSSEFKNSIMDLINNDVLRNKLKKNAFETIEKFDLSNSMEKMIEIYTKEL